MASDTKADELLVSLSREVVKVYRVYDGSNRLITEYVAFANAVNGATCLRTDYSYVDAATSPEKMKESLDVWNSSYDM